MIESHKAPQVSQNQGRDLHLGSPMEIVVHRPLGLDVQNVASEFIKEGTLVRQSRGLLFQCVSTNFELFLWKYYAWMDHILMNDSDAYLILVFKYYVLCME